jgi:RNA polymerase sigma factor (sigma-70 family)
VSTRLTPDERKRAADFARTAADIAKRAAFASGLTHLYPDLRGSAFEALSEAAHSYDPQKGKKWPHYAWKMVTWAMLDAVRVEAKRLSREPSLDAAAEIDEGAAEAGDLALIDGATAEIMAAYAMTCAAYELGESPETALLERRTRIEVEEALAELPAGERSLFEARFLRGTEWEQIAEAFGITEKTARNRCAKIREKLRKALAGPH